MKKIIYLFFVLIFFTCTAGCAKQSTKVSNQVLEIGSGSYGEVDFAINHTSEISALPTIIEEMVSEPHQEVALFNKTYQLEYDQTMVYPIGGSKEYKYRVAQVQSRHMSEPYMFIDQETGSIRSASGFNFAKISILKEDSDDTVLDKIEEKLQKYVIFNDYDCRSISYLQNGYMGVWWKSIAGCRSDSFARVCVDGEGNIHFFTVQDTCDDFPVNYTIPLQEKEIEKLVTEKLHSIYDTEDSLFVKYDETYRKLTKHQGKKALKLTFGVTFRVKKDNCELRELCDLLLMLE